MLIDLKDYVIFLAIEYGDLTLSLSFIGTPALLDASMKDETIEICLELLKMSFFSSVKMVGSKT